MNPAPASSKNFDLWGKLRHSCIQGGKRLLHGRLDRVGELLGHGWLFDRFVVILALCLKVRGQVIIWITIAVRPYDPDFLTAHFVAYCLQHTDFVVNAIDLFFAFLVFLHYQVTPLGSHNILDRNTLFLWVILPGTMHIILHESDRPNNRAIEVIISAKL